MKAPLSWLKAYVPIELDPHTLGHRMTLAGVEADKIEVRGGWDGVVVGLVKAVNPHPNADRLRLATVDYGSGEMTVVCGAPNVAAGQKIVFARAGAKLIDGHTGKPAVLKPAKIRGVESQGMVCSEKELGLSQEHEGIVVLPPDTVVGTPVDQVLGDAVIDFAVTANRPDCLSMLGLAHEVAALTSKKVQEPSLAYPESGEAIEKKTRVDIYDADLCPRYIAGVVTGIKIGPSPRWMQDRLATAGMRSINNVVDITNFVMLEFGQPLHAFDYDLLSEHHIVVRRAKAGETLVTIDGQERKLTPNILVIADAVRPVALAGVMGGSQSEVSERTTNVLLESAAFNNINIRRTSRDVGLRSEASSRFEKGLSPELPMHAARRAMQLFVELCGGTAAKGLVDVYPGKANRPKVHLTSKRASTLLGIPLTPNEIAPVLESLGCSIEHTGHDALQVTPPYWRMDLNIEDDLVEEYVRIKGFDSIPTARLSGSVPAYEPAPLLTLKERLRELLVGAGMQEIITYSLTNKAGQSLSGAGSGLKVLHPLSSDQEELRLNLRHGLLRTLAGNQRNQENGIRLFELGRVYVPRSEDLPDEREMLSAVLSGPREDIYWKRCEDNLDFFDAKGLVERLMAELRVKATYAVAIDPILHPGKTAVVLVGRTQVGVIGEVHPKFARSLDLLDRPVAYLELDLAALLEAAPATGWGYQAIARFPGVVRDLAIVVQRALPSDQVVTLIRTTELIAEVTLFDLYTGGNVAPDKKSLAYRVVFQSPSRTLTNEEADKLQERLLARLTKEFGATLRG